MAGYKIYCLGNPELELGGQLVKFETRKALALLVYLRMAGHDCSRETIAALFWPEYDQQHAQSNLRRTLSSLNKSLQIDLLTASRGRTGFDEPSQIWLDVEEFEKLLETRNTHPHPPNQTCPECKDALESALQLYQGDFMEGFNLKECTDFDEWQYLQRENLRQQLGQTLQILSETYASQLLWKEAIAHAQRWVGLDQLNETAQRCLIKLFGQAGQRKAALHQFEELSRLLSEQLGQGPEQETLHLYEQIRGKEEARKKIESPEQTALFPILKTKLFIPAPPASRVKRLDLVHRLYNVERKALTIISSPAGYGKTTLLAEWLGQTSIPVAWLSLDDGDNDLYRFLAYLIAALKSIQEDIGFEAWQLLGSSQTPSPHIILASLINDLMKIDEPYAVVLDDYQFIMERAVNEAVAYILDHLPINLHLVISTRSDPPLQVGRLRANDQILEIRAQDLRFNSEEIEEFLNKVMRLRLSKEETKALEARTEGWAVGLKMAALSLQGREDPSEFIHAFSGSQRYVLEYLMEEVMKRQPAHIQTFLLETSILESMSGPLCDALMSEEWKRSGECGQSVLEYLEKSNLFLISQDENKQWYRYHHLFADLLRLRLNQFSADKEAELHALASCWYETKGLMREAIEHAQEAKDMLRVSDLVDQIAYYSIPLGANYPTLQKWIDQLPENLVSSHPWICVIQAYKSLSRGKFDEVEEWLEKAENSVRTVHEEDEPSRVEKVLDNIIYLRAYCSYMRGDLDSAISQGKKLLDKQDSLRPKMRGQVYMAMGELYLTAGEFEKSSSLFREAWNIGIQIPDLFWFTRLAFRLGMVLKAQGSLSEAEKIYQDNLNLLKEAGFIDSYLLGRSEIGLGDITRERGDLVAAERLLTQGLRHLQLSQEIPVDQAFAYLLISQLEHEKGNIQHALEFMKQAEPIFQTYPNLKNARAIWEYYSVPLWLAMQDWDQIERWTEERHLDSESPLNYWNEQPLMALTRVYIAKGKLSDALELLARLAQMVEAGGRYGRLIEIWNLSALALYQKGDPDNAIKQLKKSLLLAEPEGFRRIYLDEGQPMIQLLKQLQGSNLLPPLKDFVNRLLIP